MVTGTVMKVLESNTIKDETGRLGELDCIVARLRTLAFTKSEMVNC